MLLTFVESNDGYMTFTDPDGADVWLQDGTFKRLVKFSDLDTHDEWRAFLSAVGGGHDRFLDHLRGMVIDPDEVDELGFCDDCADPILPDEVCSVHSGSDSVCESCFENYFYCSYCEEWEHNDGAVWVGDETYCEGCISNNFSYCDHCEEYYHYDDCHYHSHDCDCDAPAQSFSIRNDGSEPLANDTRADVALPAGELSSEGIEAVRRLLQKYADDNIPLPGFLPNGCTYDSPEYAAYAEACRLAYDEACRLRNKWYELANQIEDIGAKWQTKEGNYTKRLSKFAYKNYGLKVTPDVLSEVGNIGVAHSGGANFGIEVTRNLNLPAYEFAHEGSCWWTDYSEGRCALKNNGGFGLRSFGSYGVTGRAWVMPLKRVNGTFTPTFDTMTPDAFIVFNGYGDLSGYIPARIMAHLAGLTYRKVGFESEPMYVNGESGYLIAAEEIAAEYTDGHINLYLDAHSSLYSHEQAAKATPNQHVA